MAKAALEAINGCNLFGEQGASWSVIYVDIDAHNRNRSIFETMLPRESSSKVNANILGEIVFEIIYILILFPRKLMLLYYPQFHILHLQLMKKSFLHRRKKIF